MNHEIALSYERLRRNSQRCENEYDQIDLYELSHSLRLWTELKGRVDAQGSGNSKSLRFKSLSPSRKAAKSIRCYESVFCGMANPVLTKAAMGYDWYVPWSDYGDKIYTSVLQRDSYAKREIRHFCAVRADMYEIANGAIGNYRVSRCNFSSWLGAEAVRITFYKDSELKTYSISRGRIIKRMANAFGGSHIADDGGDFEHSDDSLVSALFGFGLAGLPLPYLILLHISQEILNAFEEYSVTGEFA